MGFFEASILHHAAAVLALTWALSCLGRCHPSVYLLCFAYLYSVHEIYVKRLRKRVQSEERKHFSQRRLLSDAESVRWLNHAVEKVWPVCMEQLSSQRFLLPIIPWFLDKYKPWAAVGPLSSRFSAVFGSVSAARLFPLRPQKKAVVHDLYLGRSPPTFTDIRVVHPATDDDHLVLELGMNFLAADDVRAVLAVKLRKRLGFGVWTKLHVTGIHVEGRVLVGVKFLRQWPFLGRLRLCFVDPPFFQATVKPIFSHGVDVTEIPGISGWVDKLMAAAFAETLVEPNMLVVDVERLVQSPEEADWFTVDEKRPLAHARVEILQGADMKPSDPNGLADPYVKGHLGPCRFQTTVRRKTLAPRWLEVFKIPITSWDAAVLRLDVFDRDYIFDDSMGSCSVNMAELRGGQRHDLWLNLGDVKTGRLRLAVTVLEDDSAGKKVEEDRPPSTLIAGDECEPVDIQGREERGGVWVQRPGPGPDSQRWEPRRGKDSGRSSELHAETVAVPSCSPAESSSPPSAEGSCGEEDEFPEEHKSHRKLEKIQRGLRKMGDFLAKSPRESSPGTLSAAESERDDAGGRTNSKGRRVIGILKHVGSSAQNNLKKVLSKKGSKRPAQSLREDDDLGDEATTADMESPVSTQPSTPGGEAVVGPVSPGPPVAEKRGLASPSLAAEAPTAGGGGGDALPVGESVEVDGGAASGKVSFDQRSPPRR